MMTLTSSIVTTFLLTLTIVFLCVGLTQAHEGHVSSFAELSNSDIEGITTTTTTTPTPEQTTPAPKQKCGVSKPYGVQKRVVSGTTALPGAWPWQALLLSKTRNGYKFTCSGALIHTSWVLTAAHCIHHLSPKYYKIRLGEFDRLRREGREQTIEVERIIVHPDHDYPTKRNNDLALIKLRRPAILTRWVNTVCLPTAKDYLHAKLRCCATGWGLTRKDHEYTLKLQQAHIPLVTKYQCRRRANERPSWMIWPYETRITHTMLCGGDDTTGASTCLGDSGGPYVCSNPEGHWVLQGITSWGSKRCLVSERYSVFTKVATFTSWIERVMTKYNKESGPTITESGSIRIWDGLWKRFFSIVAPRWLN